MMLPATCQFLISTVLLLTELLPVCLSVRPSVCPSAGRFRKPSPARHRTGLSPSSSVCLKLSRFVPGKATTTWSREERKENGENKKRKRENWEKGSGTHSHPPVRSAARSLSHSLSMSLYQSRSLLLPLFSDVKLHATNASASCHFFQNKKP